MSVFCAMQWSCNGRGATHCDKVGAAAPVLALVLVLVVAVSMYGAGFVGGVVGAVEGVVSVLILYKKFVTTQRRRRRCSSDMATRLA